MIKIVIIDIYVLVCKEEDFRKLIIHYDTIYLSNIKMLANEIKWFERVMSLVVRK